MVRVAVVGCTHGELDAIYDHVKKLNRSASAPDRVQLILCCGDFESLRNAHDLSCKACPPKYRHMNNFPEYYTGKKKAPILTVFIGGNHEASNYLRELFYGGWVAPNIFYLGTAGVINVAGLRIAGLSGIYSKSAYHRGFAETEPYSKKAVESLFLVREATVFQLAHLAPLRTANGSKRLDAVLSHDWPRNIEQHGDLAALLRERPDFQQSIDSDRFGNAGSEKLLAELTPVKWLAGHMHVRFEATVHHANVDAETHFLGLSKCDPGQACVEIVDIPSATAQTDLPAPRGGFPRIMMDIEWLAILKKTHDVLSADRGRLTVPSELLPIAYADLEDVRRCIAADFATHNRHRKGLVQGEWMTEFSCTAPVDVGGEANPSPLLNLGSPQTDEFLAMLELPHTITTPYKAAAVRQAAR
jgi:lariat debranching enzyme